MNPEVAGNRLNEAATRLGTAAERLTAMGPALLDCPALLHDAACLLLEVRDGGAALSSSGARATVNSLRQRVSAIERLFESAAGFYGGAFAAAPVPISAYGSEGTLPMAPSRGLFHCEG